MLDERRAKMVTGSQAYKIMGGWEKQLSGQNKPDVPDFEKANKFISQFMLDNERKPLAHEMKDSGLNITAKNRDLIVDFINAKNQKITTGMETYARKIAKRHFINYEEKGYQSEEMQYGNDNEFMAVDAVNELLNVDFNFTLKNQKFIDQEIIGLTPDGVLKDDFFCWERGLEVKMPTQDVHMFNILQIKNQQDLLKFYPEYYWQCQTGLLVTGAKVWDFATYNVSFDEEYRLMYIPVTPNEEHHNLLMSRATMTVERANEIKDFLLENSPISELFEING